MLPSPPPPFAQKWLCRGPETPVAPAAVGLGVVPVAGISQRVERPSRVTRRRWKGRNRTNIKYHRAIGRNKVPAHAENGQRLNTFQLCAELMRIPVSSTPLPEARTELAVSLICLKGFWSDGITEKAELHLVL